MKTLQEIAQGHENYLNIVSTFGGYVNKEDVVQEMYIRIYDHLQKYPDKEINLFYIWTTLRNIYFDIYKEDCKHCDLDIKEFKKVQTSECNKLKEEKLICIENAINDKLEELHYFDKMLFKIYTTTNKSLRTLSDEMNISVRTLHWSIKKTKEYLNNEIGEDYQDYKNNDLELI